MRSRVEEEFCITAFTVIARTQGLKSVTVAICASSSSPELSWKARSYPVEMSAAGCVAHQTRCPNSIAAL